MNLGIVLITVIFFALIVAVVAGFGAARFLMHASESKAIQEGSSHDR
jgi:uncharacterized protein YpmB